MSRIVIVILIIYHSHKPIGTINISVNDWILFDNNRLFASTKANVLPILKAHAFIKGPQCKAQSTQHGWDSFLTNAGFTFTKVLTNLQFNSAPSSISLGDFFNETPGGKALQTDVIKIFAIIKLKHVMLKYVSVNVRIVTRLGRRGVFGGGGGEHVACLELEPAFGNSGNNVSLCFFSLVCIEIL
jgi:hypothetical protein